MAEAILVKFLESQRERVALRAILLEALYASRS
jgi:hypothetical protein